MDFQIYLPTKIKFSSNILSTLEELNSYIKKKILLIYGSKNGKKYEQFKEIYKKLKNLGHEVMEFGGVKTNPEVEYVKTCINKFSQIEQIITFGGGSVHDFGKAVALGLSHTGDLSDYTVTGKLSVPAIKPDVLPVITIPTIFGTGSEVSPASLLKINNKKEIIFSEYLFPKLSVIDPSLMMDAPKKIAKYITFDAFIQALESYTSPMANSFSEVLALDAIKKCILNIPKINTNDIVIYQELAIASIEGLLSVAQAGVGAIHALSDPLSGHLDIHHGQALSIVALKVIERNYSAAQQKYNTLCKLLNNEITPNLTNLLTELKSFMLKIEVYQETPLNKYNIDNKLLEIFTKDSNNPDMGGNPKKLNENEINDIFKSLL